MQLGLGVVWALLALAGIRPFGNRTKLAVYVFAFVWVLNSLAGGTWNVATKSDPRTVDYINLRIGLLGCLFYSHFAITEFKRTRGKKR